MYLEQFRYSINIYQMKKILKSWPMWLEGPPLTKGLWVQSQVQACTGGNQLMFLSLFLSPILSLPFCLSKTNEKNILREGKKKP